MSPDAKKCLSALYELTAKNGEMCMPFRPLMDRTELDRKTVRRNVRALARKGLAEYFRGLWTEDGEPAGAGYCITAAGVVEAEKDLTPVPWRETFGDIIA